jgi:hypothetical protein
LPVINKKKGKSVTKKYGAEMWLHFFFHK